jgi:hypothetical protein
MRLRTAILVQDVAVHDLQLIRTAGDSAQQPVPPFPRLVIIAGAPERQQRERGVPQPPVPVIPVAHTAGLLVERCRRRGDDAAGRGVGQPLQNCKRSLDRLGPATGGRSDQARQNALRRLAARTHRLRPVARRVHHLCRRRRKPELP